MSECRVLWFEDVEHGSENKLFLSRLTLKLKGLGIPIDTSKTCSEIEDFLKKNNYHVIILDIMATAPAWLGWDGGVLKTPDSLTGIELLRRCRTGFYRAEHSESSLIMRTARNETFIKELATAAGADGYFLAGIDDSRLLEKIYRLVSRHVNGDDGNASDTDM